MTLRYLGKAIKMEAETAEKPVQNRDYLCVRFPPDKGVYENETFDL